MNTLVDNLERLAALKQTLADIEATERTAREVVLAKVQADLDAIDAEFGPGRSTAQTAVADLEAEIRTAVIAHGETVRGSVLMAVYAKGRESWDTKKLDGYATAHPEILPFRKVGEPSVSIRAAGGK